MDAAKPSVREPKPVATWLERGAVVIEEFLSSDGRVLAGYRAIPEAAGFLAWDRSGDLVQGFSAATYRWLPTVESARAWVLERVSREEQMAETPAPVARDTTTEGGTASHQSSGHGRQQESV